MTHAIARSARFVAILLPLLASGALATGCKKKPPETEKAPAPVQSTESRLQVAAISPSNGTEGQAFSATITGSGFAAGAAVFFGSTRADGVDLMDSNRLGVQVPALAAGSYDVVVTNPGGTSASLRGGLTISGPRKGCDLVSVKFAFDDSSLNSGQRRLLDGNMACYQAATGQISVEGHADERGTVDYNLALGQRRADSVKSYLTQGGVAPSRVRTVSYGEERPIDPGHDESAWAKNRRADVQASE